jgi:DNA-binding MarR family transcriptional regulator
MATDENLRLEHQLCVALYNATRAITGCYRPLLDDVGLTYSQYVVMLVLWEHGTMVMRELGTMLHLDSATLSPMLKRLERAGLLTRQRDADDERMLHVTITDSGRRLRHHASAAQRAVEKATGLDRSTLAALRDQLNDIATRTRAVRAVV